MSDQESGPPSSSNPDSGPEEPMPDTDREPKVGRPSTLPPGGPLEPPDDPPSASMPRRPQDLTPIPDPEAFDGSLQSVFRIIQENTRATKGYQDDLINPDGALARMHRAIMAAVQSDISEHEKKLDAFCQQISSEIGGIKSGLTEVKIRLGVVEQPNPPAVEVPFTVLVVDDEPALVRVIVRALQSHGIEALSAADGNHAIALLEENQKPDVVLADRVMPGNGGLLLDHMREHHRDIEFVMMTGHTDGSAATEALAKGAFGFLEKPFRTNDEVVLVCTRAAEQRRLKLLKRAALSR